MQSLLAFKNHLQHQVKHGQLTRSFIGVGGMYALGVPLALVINVVLARQLGPDGFGQYAFVMATFTLLTLPAAGGLPQLLTREVARSSQAEEWSLYRGVMRAAYAWTLIVAATIIGLYMLMEATSLIPGDGKWALLGIVVIMVPFAGLNAIRNGAIKGLGFPALAELPLQTIQPILLLAGITLMGFAGTLQASTALWMQVWATAITFVLATVLYLRIRPAHALEHTPRYQTGKWLRSLPPFTLISLIGTLNAQIGVVLLGILSTNESVSVLRISDRAAQFVSLSLMLVNMIIAPSIVKAYSQKRRCELQRLSRSSARGAFSIAVCVAMVLAIFGKQLIEITFGDIYVDTVYIPMLILIAGQLFNVAMGSVGILLVMSGFERMTLLGQSLGLLATAGFGLLLIPLHGAAGAAIAVSLGLIVWNVTMGVLVTKHLKIRPGIL